MFSDFSRAHAIRIMETLANYPCAKLFLYPVNSQQEGAYNYYLIVKRPMDITLIINNLLNCKYKKISEWKRDVYQIYQNSKIFNGPESCITALASQLIKHFNQELNSFYAYDTNHWKEEYQRISQKLNNMIHESNIGQNNEVYQRAIEVSQRGENVFQTVSALDTIEAEPQAKRPKFLSRQQRNSRKIQNDPLNAYFTPNPNLISADDDFVSPPEISDESKNGLHSQNSHFQSFELATSKNSNFPKSYTRQSQNHPEHQVTSIFKGIDIHDLPPQIILSDQTEKNPNIFSKNTTDSQPMHNFSMEPPAQKYQSSSIFGNIQFESLPPVFNSTSETDSAPNHPISNNQAIAGFRTTKSNLENPIQMINNFIFNDNERKFEPEKKSSKHIPQPILMPLPAIMQTKSLTNSTNSSYSREINGNFDYSSEKLSNTREETFDNSGFIDVTDYFN